jgi:predicted molibdopterin-dependent oxidoreductase YjgC
MMRVIIDENLQNTAFIEKRTTGFDALRQAVQKHSLEQAAQLTHVPVDRIVAAARAYAQAPAASIVYCMGVTQHTCGTDTVMNCANLAMLCGQIGRPGTGVNPLRGQDNVQGACDMGALPIYYPGYQPVTDVANRVKFAAGWGCAPDQLSPQAGLTLVEMTHAAAHGDIRAMLIMGENPIAADPNSQHVESALAHLDFLAIMELFMTETAQLADVILPAVSFAEKRGTKTATDRRVQWQERAIQPVGEARPDWQIIAALATRLDLAKYYSYKTEEDIFAEIQRVTPSYAGITPARLQATLGGIPWPCPSTDHSGTPILHTTEFKRPNGRGIMTPIEYAPPFEIASQEFPLVLTSGRVVMHYNSGTMTRRTRALMDREPELFVQLNPETAKQYGIRRGLARIITPRGQTTAQAKISRRIPEGVLFMPFHFPELNRLTSDALDPTAKIPEYKVAACRIEPVRDDKQGASVL